jgi:Icc-related predicted phosphoesterase
VYCFFTSDLHGRKKRYDRLFQLIAKEKPDAVFLGGDLLPHPLQNDSGLEEFVKTIIIDPMEEIRDKLHGKPEFFLILGNDDPRMTEPLFLSADDKGILNYMHQKSIPFHDFFVAGYAYIPPTPFQLKDWERYDVSRFVDVGAISPEEGFRTVDVDPYDIRYHTIAQDLEILAKQNPPRKTIYLFHAPPYNTLLDRAELDGKIIDHAPLDVHIGSIAIKRFIEEKQPFLTLHGHVHETVRLTGAWEEKIGNTLLFAGAHDGPELPLVRFSTDDMASASRQLISID